MAKRKRKTIGNHGVYYLEQARTKDKHLLLLIDQDIHPVTQNTIHLISTSKQKNYARFR